MGKARGDFTDILVKRGTLGPDQLNEARTLQQQTGAKIQDALIKLGYATQDDIMSAIAETPETFERSIEPCTEGSSAWAWNPQ